MSVSQLCPDDLLIAARRGALNAQDEARLSYHLARCERCQAALDVGRDFDGVLGARAGDDAIAMRIAAHVTQRPKRRGLAYALAGGLLLFGSVAVAAVGSRVWQQVFRNQAVHVVPNVSVQSDSETTARAPRSQAPASVEPAASASVPQLTPELPSARTTSAGPVPRSTGPANDNVTAASLFTDANSLRSKGDSFGARKLYQQLQTRFGNSTEAKVSLVSLGRIELGSAPARALRHFDAYLAQSQHTTLAEEALFGRANALQRLGRAEQERATWRQLVERFPASVYAERARARLAAAP